MKDALLIAAGFYLGAAVANYFCVVDDLGFGGAPKWQTRLVAGVLAALWPVSAAITILVCFRDTLRRRR